MNTAPMVFIQYLCGMALIETLHNYDDDSGYNKLPVKLKWPNDICKSVVTTKEAKLT